MDKPWPLEHLGRCEEYVLCSLGAQSFWHSAGPVAALVAMVTAVFPPSLFGNEVSLTGSCVEDLSQLVDPVIEK